jgi:GLPGLI family protein
MKNFTRTAIVLLCFAFAKANTAQAQQEIKGIATYRSLTKFNMPKDSTLDKRAESDPLIKMLMDQLTKGTTGEYQLFFTAKESSYDKVQELAKPEAKKTGISISFSGDGGVSATVYKNIAQSSYIKQGNIMGKDFVIEGTLPVYAWELQSESKKIGQYTCYKAIYTPVNKKEETEEIEEAAPTGILASIPERDNSITAWYTPDLPISNGPGEYHGLPGLIMEINTADTTLLCTSIEMNPSKGFELKQPKDGKKVSQKEFDEIQEKKMKESQQRSGGKGVFIETIGF